MFSSNLCLDTETLAPFDDPGDDESEEILPDELDCEAIPEETSEKMVDDDPTWTPEEIDSVYVKTGDDDADGEKCEKPR